MNVNDMIRLVIDRLLSWPVAIFGIFLIFQSPIRALLTELTAFIRRASQLRVQHKDTTLEAMADANLQVKKGAGGTADFDLGPGSAISTGKATDSDDNTIERNAVRDYGKGIASVAFREQSIKSELMRLGFQLDEPDIIDVLIRQLAAQLCVAFFERTYRIIYGSQLTALDFLNTGGPYPKAVIESIFYNTARNMEEDFYADFPFDQWLSFLISNSLIVQEGEIVGITVGGRDFLVWLVNAGLSHSKPH
jgi:hypothetical protein